MPSIQIPRSRRRIGLRRATGATVLAALLVTGGACAAQAGAGIERDGPGWFSKLIATGGDPGQSSPPRPSPAAVACQALGWAARPAIGLFTFGTFEPDQWASDTRQCRAMIVEGTMALGSLGVRRAGHARRPPVFGAGEFDRFFRDAFRSRSRVDNFFESGAGALWAPIFVSGALVLTAPAVGGRSAYRDSVSRALPLLWLGIAGNSLPTGIFKKSFGRERPFVQFGNDRAIRAFGIDDNARESFYSGHASTAFFSAAFADPVMAEMVRLGWPEYGLGSGSPPGLRLLRLTQGVLFYGLAATVAYSRIDIDKHYMSDVLAGGLVGTVHGALLYRWGYRSGDTGRRTMVTGMPGARGVEVTWVF